MARLEDDMGDQTPTFAEVLDHLHSVSQQLVELAKANKATGRRISTLVEKVRALEEGR